MADRYGCSLAPGSFTARKYVALRRGPQHIARHIDKAARKLGFSLSSLPRSRVVSYVRLWYDRPHGRPTASTAAYSATAHARRVGVVVAHLAASISAQSALAGVCRPSRLPQAEAWRLSVER